MMIDTASAVPDAVGQAATAELSWTAAVATPASERGEGHLGT